MAWRFFDDSLIIPLPADLLRESVVIVVAHPAVLTQVQFPESEI